jgi:LysR family transcriptional regulator, transcriptional activator of nhaA
MEWLNYHHLRYFWAAVREGSVTRASEKLHISQPAVSAQIRGLEDSLGEKLLTRSGRQIAVTEAGRIVYGYAEEIFGLGAELLDTVKWRGRGRTIRLVVGIADVLPKPIVRRLLEPAFRLGERIRVICREDRPVEEFMGELGLHGLDVLLADAPVGPRPVRAFSHLLGECGTTFFGTAEFARRCRRAFPRSLDGVPCLLPGTNSMLRRNLDEWLHRKNVRPAIVGEFDDSALMNIFGQDGLGVFPGPTAIEADIQRLYGVQIVGKVRAIPQRFYAISVERRLKHPAVVAICEGARKRLFA